MRQIIGCAAKNTPFCAVSDLQTVIFHKIFYSIMMTSKKKSNPFKPPSLVRSVSISKPYAGKNNNNRTRSLPAVTRKIRRPGLSRSQSVGAESIQQVKNFNLIMLANLIQLAQKKKHKLGKKCARMHTILADVLDVMTFRPLWNPKHKKGVLERACLRLTCGTENRRIVLLQELQKANQDKTNCSRHRWTAESLDEHTRQDVLFHVLHEQSKWMEKVESLRRSKQVAAFEQNSDIYSERLEKVVMQLHLMNTDVAWSINDVPSIAIALFEDALLGTVFWASCIGSIIESMIDKLCTGEFFEEGKEVHDSSAKLRSLCDHAATFLMKRFRFKPHVRATVERITEFIVYGRLAVTGFADSLEEVNETNQRWLEKRQIWGTVSMNGVGIRNSTALGSLAESILPELLFERSIKRFSSISILFPAVAVRDIMKGIAVIHEEAREEKPDIVIAADELLPILVYVLTRADLPNAGTLLHMLQEEGSKTSESAYYISCFQAAVMYVLENDVDNNLNA